MMTFLSARSSLQVLTARCRFHPYARELRADMYQGFSRMRPSAILVNGVWKRGGQGNTELVSVDVYAILHGLDIAAGSPARQLMSRCAGAACLPQYAKESSRFREAPTCSAHQPASRHACPGWPTRWGSCGLCWSKRGCQPS